MKLNKLFSITENSANNQLNFNLKKKQLKNLGLTPEELLNLNIPKQKIKRR